MRELSKVAGLTVGLDLGDRFSQFVILDAEGQIVEEGRVATTEAGLRRVFSNRPPMRIALETGTHSPWVSRQLVEHGHEVLVANSRKLRLIYENPSKDDRVDAMYLARLARFEPALLCPVEHRDASLQKDLALLRSRDALVVARTLLVNHVRGVVKSFGTRLPTCSTGCFSKTASKQIPEVLEPVLLPVLEQIASLTQQIKGLGQKIQTLADDQYPQTKLLRQVKGIGPITSLAFVLTLGDPRRFAKSRTVGAFLGLVPGRKQSGHSDPQRRITKQGDSGLRRLLVNAAHYILGPFGPDCDLRRFGQKISSRGGKLAKKKAIVAVSRKLAVLLHHLWRTGEVYEPFYRSTRKTRVTAA
jgi:transposase